MREEGWRGEWKKSEGVGGGEERESKRDSEVERRDGAAQLNSISKHMREMAVSL